MSSALQARHRWTYRELVALPEDQMRHELIDGEHFVSPSPGTPHQLIVWNLVAILGPFLRSNPVGARARPLQQHLRRLQTADKEARDREGYRGRSRDRDELAAWDRASAWPDA